MDPNRKLTREQVNRLKHENKKKKKNRMRRKMARASQKRNRCN